MKSHYGIVETTARNLRRLDMSISAALALIAWVESWAGLDWRLLRAMRQRWEALTQAEATGQPCREVICYEVDPPPLMQVPVLQSIGSPAQVAAALASLRNKRRSRDSTVWVASRGERLLIAAALAGWKSKPGLLPILRLHANVTHNAWDSYVANRPVAGVADAMSDFLGVSLRWLATGEGDVWMRPPRIPDTEDLEEVMKARRQGRGNRV